MQLKINSIPAQKAVFIAKFKHNFKEIGFKLKQIELPTNGKSITA